VGEAAVDFQLSTGRMPKKDVASKPAPFSPTLPAADIQALDQYVTALVAAGGPAIPAVDPALGNPAHGQELFNENCAACHGWSGAGGILFDRPVPAITESTPTQLGEAVRVGPAQMPVFGPHQMPAAEVNDIAAYVRSLQHPSDKGGDPISHIGPVAEGAVAWLIAMVGLLLVIRWIGERG
jgi:ubiquinol-cytochrome c reductase cytochrome c subunit